MSSPPTFERTSRTSPRSGRLTRSASRITSALCRAFLRQAGARPCDFLRLFVKESADTGRTRCRVADSHFPGNQDLTSLRLLLLHDPDSLSDCLKGLLPAHGRSCPDVAAPSPDSPVQDIGAVGRLIQPDVDCSHLRLPEPRHLTDSAVPSCHVSQYLRRHLAAALTDTLRDNTVVSAHNHDHRSADVRLLRLLDRTDLRYHVLQGPKSVNRFAEAVPALPAASAEHLLRRVNPSDCLFHQRKAVHTSLSICCRIRLSFFHLPVLSDASVFLSDTAEDPRSADTAQCACQTGIGANVPCRIHRCPVEIPHASVPG